MARAKTTKIPAGVEMVTNLPSARVPMAPEEDASLTVAQGSEDTTPTIVGYEEGTEVLILNSGFGPLVGKKGKIFSIGETQVIIEIEGELYSFQPASITRA